MLDRLKQHHPPEQDGGLQEGIDSRNADLGGPDDGGAEQQGVSTSDTVPFL